LKTHNATEIRHYLNSLPGIGEKSSRCIMMYSFGIDVSPMDTHATRVLRKFGLFPESVTRNKAHSIMDSFLPEEMAKQLHVNLVAHGRQICTSRNPKCLKCIIQSKCNKQSLQIMENHKDE
jgi:endonuclease III